MANLIQATGLLAVILLVALCCTEPTTTVEHTPPVFVPCAGGGSVCTAVQAAGYVNISVGGIPWGKCKKDDSMLRSAEFLAHTADGREVHGVACCSGLTRTTCTLRF